MTNQAINVAIAEACGWSDVRHGCGDIYALYGKMPDSSCSTRVPDYCNDLNAIHEAENWLECHCEKWFAEEGQDESAKDAYVWNLCEVCGQSEHWWISVCATAHQRAEAFLRTCGKWID